MGLGEWDLRLYVDFPDGERGDNSLYAEKVVGEIGVQALYAYLG